MGIAQHSRAFCQHSQQPHTHTHRLLSSIKEIQTLKATNFKIRRLSMLRYINNLKRTWWKLFSLRSWIAYLAYHLSTSSHSSPIPPTNAHTFQSHFHLWKFVNIIRSALFLTSNIFLRLWLSLCMFTWKYLQIWAQLYYCFSQN